GWKPVVAIYSTFLQRSFDQLIHDVCLQNLPVTLCADRAGLVGDDGKTHHGIFDITYTRCVPIMTVAAPKDENELQHLLFNAIPVQLVAHIPQGMDHAKLKLDAIEVGEKVIEFYPELARGAGAAAAPAGKPEARLMEIVT